MNAILLIGIAVIFGLLGARVVTKIKFPSVLGWLLVGIILGPSGLNLFDLELSDKLGFISDITLGLIAFLIGLDITVGTLKRLGRGIIVVILMESFGAFVLVAAGVWVFTHNLALALVAGAMAPASAPAGTVAVLQECRAKGPLTKAILTVVGADDALAIMIFVFAGSYAKTMISHTSLSILTLVGKPLVEILMAIGIGGATGFLLGLCTRRLATREILLPALLGAILMCTGLSKLLHFSLILANVVAGMVVVNTFPKVSRRLFGFLESFIPPFYIIFFVLAGAHLQVNLLLKLGIIGIIYIICRTAGLMGGAWFGATIGRQPPVIRKYLGLGILSQAGVAVGLAYLVVREFTPLGLTGKEIGMLIITTIAATTVIFEIIGPLTTKIAITKAGELGKKG